MAEKLCQLKKKGGGEQFPDNITIKVVSYTGNTVNCTMTLEIYQNGSLVNTLTTASYREMINDTNLRLYYQSPTWHLVKKGTVNSGIGISGVANRSNNNVDIAKWNYDASLSNRVIGKVFLDYEILAI